MLDEIVNHFWKVFGKRIPEGATVKVTSEPCDPETVKDVFDNQIHTVFSDEDEVYLFFIDLEPEANWSHSCAYVFISLLEHEWINAEWPPHASVMLNKV